jgi:hypothetical protein
MYSKRLSVLALAVLLAGASDAAPRRATLTVWDARDLAQDGQLSIFNDAPEGSFLGMPIGAGDLDGDRIDDVVLAPFYAPSGAGRNRRGGGALNVTFGETGMLDGRVVDAAEPPARSVQVWGAREGDFLGTEVAVADVTGDGIGDLLAGAENADGWLASRTREQAGALYILHGRTSWEATVDLASAAGPGVTTVLGERPGDRLGFWVEAGDVTGDGVEDVLVSADLAKGEAGTGFARGAVYVIPGGDLPERIDLADAAARRALGIVTVHGVDDGDHLGTAIASGDFDGDGIADLAIGAGVSRAGGGYSGYAQPNPALGLGGGDGPANDRENAGEVYVLYGRASWPETIRLAAPPPDVAVYYGEAPGDVFGEDVRAGDVDGDGRDELAVGALLADAPERRTSGIGYVLWGSGMRRGERLDLASGQSSARATRVYGERAGDLASDSLVLSDVDADGFADLLVGSPNAAPLGRAGAGDLKVIYGGRQLPPIVDLAEPGPVDVFRIAAPDLGDMFVYSLATGDVDGDGVRDLIPNAMGGDGYLNRRETAGDAYVLSGAELARRAGRGAGASTCLTRVVVSPRKKRYYAGETGIELTLVCSSQDPSERFRPGAVAILRGQEVTTELLSETELRVRLDDAPEVRDVAGSVSVQVRNPGSDSSPAIVALTLAGPTIRSVKAKAKGDVVRLVVSGRDFREGATLRVSVEGRDLAVDATRLSKKKIRATIARADVEPGQELTVVVLNPPGVASDPARVPVP